MAKVSSQSLSILTLMLTVVIFKSSVVKSCLTKQSGENAAREIGSSVVLATNDLSNSLKETSNTLARSIDKGVDATATTVRELAGHVKEMAKKVSVRVDSGDLSHIGYDATKNLKDALVELSRNWNLAVNTADLRDVGAEASRYLSEAIQNVNIKVSLNIGIDDNMVTAIGYISIAVGIAFSVCFIAIVLSVKRCRSCTVSLIMGCAGGCRGCRNSKKNNQIQTAAPTSQEPDTEMNFFIKRNNIQTPENRNGNIRQSETLTGIKNINH